MGNTPLRLASDFNLKGVQPSAKSLLLDLIA